MILALSKYGALHVFTSPRDAEQALEAIDVQRDEFEFCDATGQYYSVIYTAPPKVSRLGPFGVVDIGAFRLSAQGDTEPTLPMRFVEDAMHIEYTSFPALTSIGALRDEIRKQVQCAP